MKGVLLILFSSLFIFQGKAQNDTAHSISFKIQKRCDTGTVVQLLLGIWVDTTDNTSTLEFTTLPSSLGGRRFIETYIAGTRKQVSGGGWYFEYDTKPKCSEGKITFCMYMVRGDDIGGCYPITIMENNSILIISKNRNKQIVYRKRI